MILAGSGCPGLAADLAAETDQEQEHVTVDGFPDTEIHVQLPENLSGHVYYLQSFYPKPNRRVVETVLTLDALHEERIDVTPVFPYMAYAKQDHVFQPGEALSIRAVLTAFTSRGLTHPFFVNTHFLKEPGKHTRFNLDCTNLNAAPHLLNTVIENEDVTDPTVVLPGGGAAHLLTDSEFTGDVVAAATDRGHTGDGAYRAVNQATLENEDRVQGDVIVLDDMIATGGTMTQTCSMVSDTADTVVAAAVHGLFLGDAPDNIFQEADAVYATDTVPVTSERVGTVSAVPVLKTVLET